MKDNSPKESVIQGIHFSNSPRNNFSSLVNQCQFNFPYVGINWESNEWNITQFEKKSFSSRSKQYRLIFGITSSRKGSRDKPIFFERDWANLIKCFITIRFLERSVGIGPQHTTLTAFRYLYEVIQICGSSIEDLQNKHFTQAAKLIKEREGDSTAYRIGNSLELISKLIDRYFLTRVKTDFISNFKRTDQYDPLSGRSFDRSISLQLSEAAIEAMVMLDEKLESNDERLILESLKLLLFTGFRITELLSLERNCLLLKSENGEEFVGIRYYPLKGGNRETRIKWFGNLSGQLVKNCIYKIQKLTLEAHETTRWLTVNKNKSYLRVLFKNKEISIQDYMQVLGTTSQSAAYSSLIRAKIRPPYSLEKFDSIFRPPEKSFITFKDFKTGYELHLEKALFVIFEDSYSLFKHKKVFLPELLTEGTFMLVVSGKDDKKHPRPSIFDKYDLKDTDGKKIHITTHMFRRLLNTIYNEGGVPLTVLTKIFGRKNPKDTLSYIYTTPKKRTEDARKLFKEGALIGPKASLLREIPILRRSEFSNSFLESVHHLGFGYCLHDWSTLPCEKHIQCLDNCIDFHMDKNDPQTREYLVDQKEKALVSVKIAEEEASIGTHGASNQISHYKRIALTADRYLNELEDDEK